MARKVLLETSYTFTPSTRTISIPKTILKERLLLITNVTTNQVIYNFSDPSLGSTSYSATTNSAMVENTTIVLSYNTASMTSTDKLMFTIDTFDESFTPAEAQLDPANKFRVSQPRALIDTDFEYGTQTSKWENLGLINNRPFAYARPTPIANISSINLPTGSKTVTVTLSSGTAPANGTPVTIQDSFLAIADGNFIIENGGGGSSFTYTASAINRTSITEILDPNKTIVNQGVLFSGAQIGGSASLTYSGRKITAVTSVPHGLALGNEIVVLGATATTNPPNGNQEVAQIINTTTFAFYVDVAPTGTIAGGIAIFVRPQSTFAHRPHDGGVLFSANSGSNYAQCVRQTRRYFRYQSGKGIQISSGTVLKPYAGIENITSNNTVAVTVQTKEKHNLQPGTVIKIGGCNEVAYNGTFTITNVLSATAFQYQALSIPSATVATGPFYASVEAWYGCQNRLGAFDEQNGLFWEYDGTTLYAVRRSSTFQLSGKVTVSQNSATILQSSAEFPTYFSKQLISGNLPGRYESSTNPPYTKATTEILTTDAALTVASTAGFPPSGTLVIRNESTYEYVNYTGKSATTFTGLTRGKAGVEAGLTVTIATGTSTGTVASATGIQVGQRVISNAFPEGTFISSITGTSVQFSKAALTDNPTGVIIAPMGATSAQAFTFAATSPTMVELAFPSFSASISHWGTSVIMDGNFDEDKSLVFTYGQRTSTSITAGASRALMAIRVAPSVDNGIAAAFGQRELINRMQLTLKALDVTTSLANANLLVTAVLNGVPSTTNAWTNAVGNVVGVANSSLAQIVDYSSTSTTLSGGEVTAGFFVGTGANSIDLSNVRDLGNSIVGGGSVNSNTNIYPDGPDTLTIVVTNIGTTTAPVFARLSWTEAQA